MNEDVLGRMDALLHFIFISHIFPTLAQPKGRNNGTVTEWAAGQIGVGHDPLSEFPAAAGAFALRSTGATVYLNEVRSQLEPDVHPGNQVLIQGVRSRSAVITDCGPFLH